MFNKLKNRLKYKLMDWLEIEQLQNNYNKYIKQNDRDKFNFERNIEWLEEQLREIENNYNNQLVDIKHKLIENKDLVNNQFDKIEAINRTLQSIISIGTDVVRPTPYDKNSSWAVVCIEGRYNIVKFIDLRGQDYRYMLDFLKQFECSRHVIDAPDFRFFEEAFVWEKEK